VGLRQQLNDNPRIVAAVSGGLVLIALIMFIWPRSGLSGSGKPAGVTKEFFSTDDGKTWFPDDAGKLPPFDKDGKPAYRVRVYRCPHGKEFVSHLERYADGDRKRMQDLIDDDKTRSMEFIKLESEFEMKKSGGRDWIKLTPENAGRANALRVPKCPEGSTVGITRVSPG
jgi:hypothetical protein